MATSGDLLAAWHNRRVDQLLEHAYWRDCREISGGDACLSKHWSRIREGDEPPSISNGQYRGEQCLGVDLPIYDPWLDPDNSDKVAELEAFASSEEGRRAVPSSQSSSAA